MSLAYHPTLRSLSPFMTVITGLYPEYWSLNFHYQKIIVWNLNCRGWQLLWCCPALSVSIILTENAVSLWKTGRDKESCTCPCLGMDLDSSLSLAVQEMPFYMGYRPSERHFKLHGFLSDVGLTFLLLCFMMLYSEIIFSVQQAFKISFLGCRLFASQARASGNYSVLCCCTAERIKVSLVLLNSVHNIMLVTMLERSIWDLWEIKCRNYWLPPPLYKRI